VIGALAEGLPFFMETEMKIRNARLRHGHASGHVRETFCAAVDAFLNWKPGQAEPMVEYEVNYEPHLIPISRACTLVWNCTDIAPSVLVQELCDDAQLEMKSSTYAACARAIHAAILSRIAFGLVVGFPSPASAEEIRAPGANIQCPGKEGPQTFSRDVRDGLAAAVLLPMATREGKWS
jgi:hypothetical protein